MAKDLFKNQGSTTVSSGGTTAPAQGTQETWTVASSATFPAASSTASPVTQFYVVDPAAPSEIIRISNVSGTTWTAIRGADSTTPVIHATSFTVQNVVPATWLQEMENRVSQVFDVTEYGAVGDGTTACTTAFQAAMDAASTYGGTNKGAILRIPTGQYKLGTTRWVLKSNVVIEAYGAYIFNGTQNVSMAGTAGGSSYGSGASDNITIRGGIWDSKAQSAATDATYSCFEFFNCKNINLRDVTIRNVAAWHGCDVSAVDGFTVIGCRFEGFRDTTSGLTRQYSEAIQIDGDNTDSTPTINATIFNSYLGVAQDGSGLGSFGCFVGSHTDNATFLYSNIKVIGNTINAPITTAVRPRSWTDSVIANNTVSGGVASGFGAIHCVSGVNNKMQRISITGNVIKNSAEYGINVDGSTAGREFEDCNISNNIVEGSSNVAFRMSGVYYSTISNNTIRGGSNDGIELSNSSSYNSINGNTLYNISVAGIQVDSGTGNSVTANTLYTIGTRGIWLSNSTTKNIVSGNIVTGAGRTTNATYGAFEISNTANNNNFICNNTARKFGSGNEALTPVVVAGSTPANNVVIGNNFQGWSATHSLNFTLNGATLITNIDAVATANSIQA